MPARKGCLPEITPPGGPWRVPGLQMGDAAEFEPKWWSCWQRAGEGLCNPEEMSAPYFVPWSKRLSKVDQNLPQLWGEGSLRRMPLEGKIIWERGPGSRAGHRALLKGPGALTWTLQGERIGSWGQEGSTLPPPPERAEQTRWGWRLTVKATLGNPARSGPHPESSPQSPQAAFFGLQGCGELTRRPGASAPPARPCRRRGRGVRAPAPGVSVFGPGEPAWP